MPRLCPLPNLHVLIHSLLCSLAHSHSLNHLNYCNMCRLDYAMMLSATLLAPTRYATVSKHHAASNVTVITYIEEIVKHWGNSEVPRKIREYRSNSRWRHQLEKFSAILAFCVGNSPVTGEFPAQRPVTRSFDVFFDLDLNKCLTNNREAGDLRRHRTHYTGIVMWCTDYFVDSPSAAVVLTILGQAGINVWYFEDDFKSIFSIEALCILIHSSVKSVPSFFVTINKRRIKYWHWVRDKSLPV